MTDVAGGLITLEYALEFPVLTIGCGPTNSIRGAAHLSGATDALVVDIGGTTTDIGVLVDGFPRQSAHAVEIGGIRTNFRMPDVLSVGLGGGTTIRETESGTTVGPDTKVSAGVGFGKNTRGEGFNLDITLHVIDHGLDQAVINDLIHKAHQVCPYSNATRGNIEVALSAE